MIEKKSFITLKKMEQAKALKYEIKQKHQKLVLDYI